MMPLTAFAPHTDAPRSADNFDAVDIGEDEVVPLPEDTREKRRVNRASVDHHQKFVSEAAVETAGGNGPGAGVYLCCVKAGHGG